QPESAHLSGQRQLLALEPVHRSTRGRSQPFQLLFQPGSDILMSFYPIFGKLPADFIASKAEQWGRMQWRSPSRIESESRIVAENYWPLAHNKMNLEEERSRPTGPVKYPPLPQKICAFPQRICEEFSSGVKQPHAPCTRRFWRLCAILLCAAQSVAAIPARGADRTTPVVLDHVMAVVNNRAILASDVKEEMLLS